MFLIDLEEALKNFVGEDWMSYRKKLVFLFDNAAIHTT